VLLVRSLSLWFEDAEDFSVQVNLWHAVVGSPNECANDSLACYGSVSQVRSLAY
jgi:hypothetical protein